MFRAGKKCTMRTHGPSNGIDNADLECARIQKQKDILLTSLTKYFAKEIDKDNLKSDLRSIKQTLITTCTSYKQTNTNLCC
jgi:hypothetical protein